MPRAFDSARNRSLPPHGTRKDGRIPAGLERLRAHVRRLEGFGGTLAEANRHVLPFGIDEIDSRLPGGGLARGALHEVFAGAAGDAGVATAFCALLAGRLVQNASDTGAGDTGAGDTDEGALLWCERPRTLDAGALYGPALLPFGIDPARLILVRARRDADALWALEQGLRCGGLAAAVGEVAEMSLTASRRLQLAAEETGVTALVLRPRAERPAPSAAATRWRLAAAESVPEDPDTESAPPGLGGARWRAELFRSRGGAAGNWTMEWSDETGDLTVAAELRDRPAVPAAAGLAG